MFFDGDDFSVGDEKFAEEFSVERFDEDRVEDSGS